jgi:transcriptional regulator with XRE-family HTH domain
MSPASDEPPLFAARLREARESRGLSQADLAEKTGFQPSAISHFENGRREPSFDTLKTMAEILGVTIDHLLGRDTAPKTGQVAERMFRDFRNLSSNDQQMLADLARSLARKKPRKE